MERPLLMIDESCDIPDGKSLNDPIFLLLSSRVFLTNLSEITGYVQRHDDGRPQSRAGAQEGAPPTDARGERAPEEREGEAGESTAPYRSTWVSKYHIQTARFTWQLLLFPRLSLEPAMYKETIFCQ